MKHVIFAFVLLVPILLSISTGTAAVNVNLTNSQATLIDQSTIKFNRVSVDIDGVPLPDTYWAVVRWDPVNLVFVPISYGPEAKPQTLRVFVTSTKHVGDFKNDPLLPGATATQKADALCNSDAAKPTSSIYKALLVDGVNRDAVSGIDWVLQPNTTYYRADGITVIGATTGTAIFPALYTNLSNSILEQPAGGNIWDSEVWTGIGNAADFSAGGHCLGWSSGAGTDDGDFGYAYTIDQRAFIAMLTNCDARNSLYCVEQP